MAISREESIARSLLDVCRNTDEDLDFSYYVSKETALLFVDNLENVLVEGLTICEEDLTDVVILSVVGYKGSYEIFVEPLWRMKDDKRHAFIHEAKIAIVEESLSEFNFIKTLYEEEVHYAESAFVFFDEVNFEDIPLAIQGIFTKFKN